MVGHWWALSSDRQTIAGLDPKGKSELFHQGHGDEIK
jgi:hypothetical protein